MRLLHNEPWKFLVFLAGFLTVALGIIWICLATGGPINAANFRKLKTRMSRAEVEAILGNRASSVEDVRGRFDETAFLLKIKRLPPPLPQPKLGDLTMGPSIQVGDLRAASIAEWQTWEGSEGRIIVALDDEERVLASWFLQRVTWRYRLERQLPR